MFHSIKNTYFQLKYAYQKRTYSIYKESKIIVTDNSGVRLGKCIQAKPFSKRKGTKPIAIIKMSAKKVKSDKKVLKGDLCRGVLVRRKKMYQRDTGLSFKCNDNSVVLLDNKNLPIASRIDGLIFREMRHFDLYPKIIQMTKIKL